MTLLTEWRAISARIEGLRVATDTYVSTVAGSDDPHGGAVGVLLPESREIYSLLRSLLERHRHALGPAATRAVERFLTVNEDCFVPGGLTNPRGLARAVPALVAVRSEVGFHLADHSANARRVTERAFLHLQRSIVADAEVRRRWSSAFVDGEPACEKLGAAHLLLHGIWAFKVHGEGERTDLVMNEPITDLAPVERVAEALVLTEWKKVVGPGDLDRKAAEARRQASRYGHGVLGGIELASYAYIVLVSEHHFAVEHLDRDEGDRRYVHVNVAVDPQSPSKK